MLNQNQKNMLRKELLSAVESIDLSTITTVEFLEVVGYTTEGLALSDGKTTVILRAIVKNDGFDLDDALAEQEEKLEAIRERELKKAEKANKAKKAKED